MDDKYVAYDADAGENKEFKTLEEAKKWLLDQDFSDGISDEFCGGFSYIAKITHRSSFKKTDEKENYPCIEGIRGQCCEYQDIDCPDNCCGEEWPYDSDINFVGDPEIIEVENK